MNYYEVTRIQFKRPTNVLAVGGCDFPFPRKCGKDGEVEFHECRLGYTGVLTILGRVNGTLVAEHRLLGAGDKVTGPHPDSGILGAIKDEEPLLILPPKAPAKEVEMPPTKKEVGDAADEAAAKKAFLEVKDDDDKKAENKLRHKEGGSKWCHVCGGDIPRESHPSVKFCASCKAKR